MRYENRLVMYDLRMIVETVKQWIYFKSTLEFTYFDFL